MSSILDDFFNKGRPDRKPAEIDYQNEKPNDRSTLKIKAKIYGRVQGVGFRFSTKYLADKLGVRGSVRNESDGSVYVEAIGSEDQIETFMNELAKGPSPNASVSKVVIEYDETVKDYEGFHEQD